MGVHIAVLQAQTKDFQPNENAQKHVFFKNAFMYGLLMTNHNPHVKKKKTKKYLTPELII